MIKIIDLRPDESRKNELRANYTLEKDDEKIAQKLTNLSLKLKKLDYRKNSYKKHCERIRKIGEFLCSNGGTNRMDLICYRVAVLAGSSRHCRQNWDGICGWSY